MIVRAEKMKYGDADEKSEHDASDGECLVVALRDELGQLRAAEMAKLMQAFGAIQYVLRIADQQAACGANQDELTVLVARKGRQRRHAA